MVQTAPNTLRNSIQAGFWGPFTASQRVFRALGNHHEFGYPYFQTHPHLHFQAGNSDPPTLAAFI